MGEIDFINRQWLGQAADITKEELNHVHFI